MGIDQVTTEAVAGGLLAILDRDGTLIDVVRDEESGAISVAFHPSHVRILEGVVVGLTRLQAAGFRLAMATNQPGPAKGQYTKESVKRTNDALVERLAREGITIERVKVCMHHPKGGEGGDASLVGPCECRKPKAGMLEELIAETGADRARAWMIGDSSADLDAARAAGIKAALVFATNRCELCPLRNGPAGSPDVHGPSFLHVAEQVLASL